MGTRFKGNLFLTSRAAKLLPKQPRTYYRNGNTSRVRRNMRQQVLLHERLHLRSKHIAWLLNTDYIHKGQHIAETNPTGARRFSSYMLSILSLSDLLQLWLGKQ